MNQIVRKFFIYAAVFIPLIAVYRFVTALLVYAFAKWPAHHATLSTIAAAAIFSFGFHPLRRRIQTFLDTRFFRQFAAREEQLHELSREVVTHATPEAMSEALMRVIAQTLDPKTGALYLLAPEGNSFVRMSGMGSSQLPQRMDYANVLARYFRSRPQPFVRDTNSKIGNSHDTRGKSGRENAA